LNILVSIPAAAHREPVPVCVRFETRHVQIQCNTSTTYRQFHFQCNRPV